MNRILAAATLAVTASAAFADTMPGQTSMLAIAADREIMELGIHDVDTAALSLTQVSLINAITASSDYSPNEKAKQVRAIVGY